MKSITNEDIEALANSARGAGQLNPFTRRECQNLLGLLERFNKEIESTRLPSDSKSMALIEQQWRGRLAIYGQIARNIIRAQAEQRGNEAIQPRAVGKRGNDSPICHMPYVDPARLPDKPTMKLPGPRRSRQ